MKGYSSKWYEVYKIVDEARCRVVEIVAAICDMLRTDIGGMLDGLAEKYGFTYVIEPYVANGDLSAIRPCVFIGASVGVVKDVEEAVLEKFAVICSESRVMFVSKPSAVELD